MANYGAGDKSQLPRGPYGTNEGDIWLMGEYYQERIQREKGPQWRMIVEMLRRDGEVQECFYTTEVPELVERADAGHPKWVAAQAARN